MALVTAAEVYIQVRAFLNDPGFVNYTDTILSPFLKQAHLELQAELQLNSAQVVVDQVDSALNAAIGVVKIAFAGGPPVLPADLLYPIKLLEKDQGALDSTYIPMYEVRDLPYRNQLSTLIQWSWKENELQFVGATSARTIKVIYIRDLALAVPGPPIGGSFEVLNCLTFLSYRVAAIVSAVIMENLERAQILQEPAQTELDKLVAIATKSQQGIPVRQRPYQPFRRFSWYFR